MIIKVNDVNSPLRVLLFVDVEKDFLKFGLVRIQSQDEHNSFS